MKSKRLKDTHHYCCMKCGHRWVLSTTELFALRTAYTPCGNCGYENMTCMIPLSIEEVEQ